MFRSWKSYLLLWWPATLTTYIAASALQQFHLYSTMYTTLRTCSCFSLEFHMHRVCRTPFMFITGVMGPWEEHENIVIMYTWGSKTREHAHRHASTQGAQSRGEPMKSTTNTLINLSSRGREELQNWDGCSGYNIHTYIYWYHAPQH